MIIDIHSEIVPKSYLKKLCELKKIPKIEQDENGNYKLQYDRELSYSFDQKMYSLNKRIDDMEKAGIDVQVLGLALPGVDLLEPDLALELARNVNNEIAEIVEKHDKFIGLATVPLLNPEWATEELERAINSLGLKGVKISSNIGGKTLDCKDFWPFYEKVERLDIPIMIHPTKPLMVDALRDFGLTNVVGFLFDTTLATLRIIFGGILEKYKKLKFLLPHLGSTIPYIISRIDHQYRINPECREKISKLPSEYFKSIYIDTAQSFYEPAMMCAYALMGPDKIIFGSDYPFASLEQSVNCVKNMNIPPEEKEKILGKNAIKILNI